MHPSRRQLIAYAVLAAIVVAVGVRYLASSGRVEKQAIEISAAVASPSPTAAASVGAPPPPLVVYACGAVSRPGVYDLPAGSRIADLLALAEPSDKADLTSINLAARLADGQQVVVPLKGAVVAQATGSGAGGSASMTGGGAVGSDAAGTTTAGSSQTAPVSLNTATLEQLDTLQGVGPSTAQKIIDYRAANGGFKSIDELKNVPGIGDVRFAALKDAVTL
ncbi:MAG TPA: helix-hairpin-helix domain-containing protein [Thermoleophilia bacterium]|nr:helix-hairpin-helix domain-containing protein [Thermoleophilia bacterium]